MHLLSILLISINFAILHAFPDMWASEPKALRELDPLTHSDIVILHPIDPNDSERITQTEAQLGNICGSEHVKNIQTTNGQVSWIVTLNDREIIDQIQDHPGLILDESAKRTLVEFFKRREKRSALDRHDDAYYNILARDYTNDEETKATRDFLNTKLTDPNRKIGQLKYPGTNHILGWGRVQLSDAAKAEVEAYPGVRPPLGRDVPLYEDRAVMTSEPLPANIHKKEEPFSRIRMAYKSMINRTAHLKRAVTWVKQANAGWDLIMVSQPKEMKDEQLKDFVYDQNAGEGTWIYILDSGVACKVKNKDGETEFEHSESLQTGLSKEEGEAEDQDDAPNSHGTVVASKAAGKKYGVAKKATLVSVKMAKPSKRSTFDYMDALDAAANDLVDKPERVGKAVIVSSIGFPADEGDAEMLKPLLELLFELGVPFVASAGNGGASKNIGNLPKTLEGPDMPIINVGATDEQRKRADYSQGGPQLTLYAPGGTDNVKIAAQLRDEGEEGMESGTSLAAPIVGGVIATYLNFVPLPWDGTKKGKERVQAIKDFIKTVASSWDDQGLERGIWNGATKVDHQSAGANSQQPKGPTRALIIVSSDKSGEKTFDWLFFSTDYGKKVDCRIDTLIPSHSVPRGNTKGPNFPGGTFPLVIDGMNCQYMNSGNNNGKLFCGDRAIDCLDDRPTGPKDAAASGKVYQCGDKRRETAYSCPF